MLTEKITAYIAQYGQVRRDTPVNVEFGFDPKHDPFAISALFKGDIVEDEAQVWTFARDLIMRGSTSISCYGDGDVRFQYFPEKEGVIMCLKNPTGHADVWLDHEELIAFLEKTTELLPVGEESTEEAVDEILKELLG